MLVETSSRDQVLCQWTRSRLTHLQGGLGTWGFQASLVISAHHQSRMPLLQLVAMVLARLVHPQIKFSQHLCFYLILGAAKHP